MPYTDIPTAIPEVLILEPQVSLHRCWDSTEVLVVGVASANMQTANMLWVY